MVERYLANKEEERCGPIASALAAHGIEAETRVVENERVSKAILDECAALGADVLLIGSHGEGRFEGLLGSTGTKLTRHSTCPVLLIR
jgi:nucleotide-binding universal stress UspA family protein